MAMKPTLIRFTLGLCTAVAGSALLAGAAMAQAERTEKNPPRASDQTTAAPAQLAPVPIVTNARMAALIQAGGTLIKQKNVEAVSHPATGIYCIKPTAASGVVPGNSVALLTVEFFYSHFNEVQAQWAQRGSPCPTDRFAVYTIADRNLDARYTFSNEVGFLIVVP
jgi:hypothetical protein